MRVLSQGEIDNLLANLLPDSSILPSEPAAPKLPSSLAEKIAAANAAKADSGEGVT